MCVRRWGHIRVPLGKSLASWIRELERDGKLYRFYKTDEWLDLRDRVMRANHNECSMCKRKQPAVYTRAEHVHHVNEVRLRPELALSRTYRDATGVHDNLLPLCRECHNAEHERFYRAEDKPQLNLERW